MHFYDDLGAYLAGEAENLLDLPGANLPEVGIVEKVLASPDSIPEVRDPMYSVTEEVPYITVDSRDGIKGDSRHWGPRITTGRERELYPKGTAISQKRHVLAISNYDCQVMSQALGVDVTPELLGANIVIGREDGNDYSLSALPHGTHLVFADPDAEEMPRPGVATMIHYVRQEGCGTTGLAIATYHDDRSLVRRFREESTRNRGILLTVEFPHTVMASRPSNIEAGQRVFFKHPMYKTD